MPGGLGTLLVPGEMEGERFVTWWEVGVVSRGEGPRLGPAAGPLSGGSLVMPGGSGPSSWGRGKGEGLWCDGNLGWFHVERGRSLDLLLTPCPLRRAQGPQDGCPSAPRSHKRHILGNFGWLHASLLHFEGTLLGGEARAGLEAARSEQVRKGRHRHHPELRPTATPACANPFSQGLPCPSCGLRALLA